MAASRFQQRRVLRCVIVLSCLGAMAHKISQRAFAVAPLMLEERQARTATAVREAPVETRQAERRHNATEQNVSTLELSSGFPDNNVPGTAQNPPWAKCVVEAQDRSMRADDGTVMPRMVLEEWVMKGTKEHIGTFQGWRQMRKDFPKVRCHETSLNEVQGVTCLECVSARAGGLPPPSLSPTTPGLSEVFQTSFVMTFGVPQCLNGARHGMGFCKSASAKFSM